VFGEPTMQTSAGSRKRIFLSRYSTYTEALAAKLAEERYPQDQLQIKKRDNGNTFDLLARIIVKNTKIVENA
jgi:hypothetical protein